MTRVPAERMETDLVQVARFVQLVDDLTLDTLSAVDIDALPSRDRTYVRRLRCLTTEDTHLIRRQRIVWLKLRQGIPLLETEARELLEVLGCRGFYFSGLDLDGMFFCTLDLSGGMIVGDYSCQYTHVRGLCDERELVVVGHAFLQHRRVEGRLVTDGCRVLNHPAGARAVNPRRALRPSEHPAPSEAAGSGGSATDDSNDEASGIEELSEDDIINSCPPPATPARAHRSGRPAFPPPPPSSLSTATRRVSSALRVGSSRCSRPPRNSVSPRSSPSRQSLNAISVSPDSLRAASAVTPDTSDIDLAWEK